MFIRILLAIVGMIPLLAVPSAMASVNDPAVVCEAAVIKTPIANSNAISVVYVAYQNLSARQVRAMCLGDQRDGGDGNDSDSESK